MNKRITSLTAILMVSVIGGGRAQFSETSDLSYLQKTRNRYTTELNTLKSKQDKNKKAQIALSVVSAISGAAALSMGLTAAFNKNLTDTQKKGLIAGAVMAGGVAVGMGIGAGVVTAKKNKLQKEIVERSDLISQIDNNIAKTEENMKDKNFGYQVSGEYIIEKDKVIDEFNKKVQNSYKKEEFITDNAGRRQKVITNVYR